MPTVTTSLAPALGWLCPLLKPHRGGYIIDPGRYTCQALPPNSTQQQVTRSLAGGISIAGAFNPSFTVRRQEDPRDQYVSFVSIPCRFVWNGSFQ